MSATHLGEQQVCVSCWVVKRDRQDVSDWRGGRTREVSSEQAERCRNDNGGKLGGQLSNLRDEVKRLFEPRSE